MTIARYSAPGDSLRSATPPFLGFPLPETVTTLQELFQLPEIIAYQQTPLWRQTILSFRKSAPGLLAVRSMPDAVEGVNQLADLGTIHYCTVRKAAHQVQQEAIQQATHTWLTNKHFPLPDQTIFCRSIMNKLLRISAVLQNVPTVGVMIDDLYEEVIAEFRQLQQGDHPRLTAEESIALAAFLLQRLLLVAFGAATLPTQTFGLQVAALPSWDHYKTLLPFLHQAKVGGLSLA